MTTTEPNAAAGKTSLRESSSILTSVSEMDRQKVASINRGKVDWDSNAGAASEESGVQDEM